MVMLAYGSFLGATIKVICVPCVPSYETKSLKGQSYLFIPVVSQQPLGG